MVTGCMNVGRLKQMPHHFLTMPHGANVRRLKDIYFNAGKKTLRNRAHSYDKVLWKHDKVAKATWDLERKMREEYPALFNPGM